MFRHILIPSDGSPASDMATASALRFARDAGARVTAIHVLPEEHVLSEASAAPPANPILQAVATQAKALGVPCRALEVRAERPHAAIMAAALQHSCDLIAMASRGRGGLASLMLGSETQKVLAHSTIPVLIYRGQDV